MDQLTTIDEQINRLKKKKERVQTQQAITFMREAQKIFQTDFSPDVALSILSETWGAASETQKQNWRKLDPANRWGRGHPFRSSPVQSPRKKTQPTEPTYQQSWNSEAYYDGSAWNYFPRIKASTDEV